jgi:hypothetical protein
VFLPRCQVVGRVATPDLGGEQVAVLPLTRRQQAT